MQWQKFPTPSPLRIFRLFGALAVYSGLGSEGGADWLRISVF